MGLMVTQHNGNLVIKMHEMHDMVTMGLLYTMYNLFQKISIVKPYASTFLSSRQYLICKGLKQRRPQEVITKLANLQAYLLDSIAIGKPKRLVHCQRLMQLLEDENYLLNAIRQHNSVLVSLRNQLFHAATKQQSSAEIECFHFK